MIVVILAVLGLCLGSFVNAVVWRIRQQSLVNGRQSSVKNKKFTALATNDKRLMTHDLSILKGRSMCPDCKHGLSPKDLIPVFSWLALRGHCRYCHRPISSQYPLVELATAAVFAISYMFWPLSLAQNGQELLFVSWLFVSVGLMALLVYDFKWMLLPNRILYPTFFVALAGRLAYIGFYSSNIPHSLFLLLGSLLVSSGLFYLLFYASKGRWIGYGDVRLGLITGTVLGRPSLSLLMIFTASVLGTLFAAPALATGRKTLVSKLPYGPFLIAATGFTLLWGGQVIHWYKGLLA